MHDLEKDKNGEIKTLPPTQRFGKTFISASAQKETPVQAPSVKAAEPQEMIPTTPKKPKASKASGLRAKEKDPARTRRMTFFATEEEYTDILVAKARQKKPITDFLKDATLAMLYNGYICAQCGESFTLLNRESKPTACPCCGNDKLSRIVKV